MSNADFPCNVDIRTPEQLQQSALRFINRDSSPDFRDDLRSLAWYYHTAKLLGMNPNSFFLELESVAPPFMAGIIESFRTRPPSEKAMDQWGLYVADSPQGQYIENRP